MICKVCNKKFENIKNLTEHLVKEHNFSSEELYEYYDYSFETGEAICPICNNKFIMSWRQKKNHEKGISKAIGCSAKCSRQLLEIIYGNPSTWDSVKEKKKQTNLRNWGVENVFQSQQIKDKSKKTNLENRGVEYAMQSKEVREKSKETNLEKYGVEHVSQRKDIKERKEQKSLEKYGVSNISQAEEIKEKKKQKSLEKYGVECTLQALEVRQKGIETNLKKYGVKYSAQAEEVKERAKKTNLERYGAEYAGQVPQFKEKIKQTNLERYGVEYGIASKEVKEKSTKTIMERYGVEYFCQHKRCIEANGHRISRANKNFRELLENNKIESELEFIIENVGYDLKSGNTLVEIDPAFTHNVTAGPMFGGKERKCLPFDYHLSKTNFAKEHGYSCIHVFDWDDKNKVVSLLLAKNKLYARKCEVREIVRKEAKEFLEKYHLQGSTKQCEYAYGLFHEGELVEVMTFGKPRYNKKYEYELLRLCTKRGLKVIGGANKILAYFEEHIKPKTLISYCDLSKFNGEVYNKLGFKLEEQTTPAKHWYNPKTRRHITDNLLRQRGFDQLHNANFGKGTLNEELMREHGYVEIYDCGQLVFVKNY